MIEKTEDITLKTLYAKLFIRLKNLIIKPSSEWKRIHGENSGMEEILSGYSLPLIAICTLTSFLSTLVSLQQINFEIALKHALIIFLALFGGLYSSYIVTHQILTWFQIVASKLISFRLVAYASTPLLIIHFLVTLFPELLMLYMASVYSYYIIWQGIKGIPGLKPDKVLTIGVIITFIIHFFPFFVQQILKKLIFM